MTVDGGFSFRSRWTLDGAVSYSSSKFKASGIQMSNMSRKKTLVEVMKDDDSHVWVLGSNLMGKDCGYRCYIDSGIFGPAVAIVNFLYLRVEKLVAENVLLRSKLREGYTTANEIDIIGQTSPAPATAPLNENRMLIYNEIIAEHFPWYTTK